MTRPETQVPILQFPDGIDEQVFLDRYWQRTPLLFRNAFPLVDFGLDESDLAGLALESDVESRLVLEQDGPDAWRLREGPFDEATLTSLPERGWSLLIQGLDQWVPAISELLDQFRFLPEWRLDDVMASIAPPGGSVGPHFDAYDVFLLQVSGRKQWQIGPPCDQRSPCRTDTDLKILSAFDPRESWTLEPGDMLYLPPAVGHHGVALDRSITFSVGFRSPILSELLPEWIQEVMADNDGPVFPADKQIAEKWPYYRKSSRKRGQLPPELLLSFLDRIRRLAADTATMQGWLGRALTRPAPSCTQYTPDTMPAEPVLISRLLEGSIHLRWSEGARYLYHSEPVGDERLAGSTPHVSLFADGLEYALPSTELIAVESLCSGRCPMLQPCLDQARFPVFWTTVHKLIASGALLIEER